MTTLKVTVDNKKNARLLTRFLRNMNFVKKVEEENSVVKDQYTNLEKIFNSIESNDLFSGVKEPVKWQKKIRDEWETR
jgi:predicted AAA+ superfamily ATPase